jgi:hypothetical protein
MVLVRFQGHVSFLVARDAPESTVFSHCHHERVDV